MQIQPHYSCPVAKAGAAIPFLPIQPEIRTLLDTKMDEIATELVSQTGVPSVSIAIVSEGRIAYVNAFGSACLKPNMVATPATSYNIGSVSKQFTAAAILLLAEEGKLSLDDKVAIYLPNLSRSEEISIRMLLAHTSGYQDNWPQDFLTPLMKVATTTEKIMDMWARQPLDFEPGSRWQYSNTGYVIAGAILERVTGTSLFSFLQERIFKPLDMNNVGYQGSPMETDAIGYSRNALGPLRPSPLQGQGWQFAAGGLVMTAEDLARWDLSVMNHNLLGLASRHEMETEVRLDNGLGTGYGLGIAMVSENGRRVLQHGGRTVGFTATNTIYPDDHAAIVVLANQGTGGVPASLTRKIAAALFDVQDPATPKSLEKARNIFTEFQRGVFNLAPFTANGNSYFDEDVRKDVQESIGILGEPISFTQVSQCLRGGMTRRDYRVRFSTRELLIGTLEMSDGKLEQYMIYPDD